MAKRDELAAAILRAGSAAALGRLLGVRAETVRGWQRRGLTPGARKLLGELKERQKLHAAEEKGKRQTFDLLFKLAGERGDYQKIKARTREGLRTGPRTSGYHWTLGVNEMLTRELIRRIDAWLTSKRRRFSHFQAVAVATEYTKQTFKGYKVVMKPVADQAEAAGDFAVSEQIATRRDTKLSTVRDELIAKLEESLEEGALVYIHEVTLFNYRLRTEEERLAWERTKRNLRKRRAKRRKSRRQAAPAQSSPLMAQDAKTQGEKVTRPTGQEKQWPKKTSTIKSKKPSKKTKNKQTPATIRSKASQALKKSSKHGVLRSKSASTRSQTTRLSSKPASVKASRPKTSALRSQRTMSKKFGTKRKSSLARSIPKRTLAVTTKGRAKTTKKTTKKTAKKTAKKTTRRR